MRGALERSRNYLEANARAPRQNVYAAMIEGFLDTVCQGNDGKFDRSIRDRLTKWVPLSKQDLWPYGFSPRARLLAMFVPLSGPVVWWGDRPPKARDLAVINLLAGLLPGGVKQAQRAGVGATRPTVLDVVRAEEKAVSIALSRKRRRTG